MAETDRDIDVDMAGATHVLGVIFSPIMIEMSEGFVFIFSRRLAA